MSKSSQAGAHECDLVRRGAVARIAATALGGLLAGTSMAATPYPTKPILTNG